MEAARRDGRPYHVVHFDGHGTTLPLEGGIGALCFEQADGAMDLVRATQFGDVMARYNIPLVVLEACRTATKTFSQDTVAGALLRQGVGTVLAMGHAVHVDMTRELMAAFYQAIAAARRWARPSRRAASGCTPTCTAARASPPTRRPSSCTTGSCRNCTRAAKIRSCWSR